MKQIYSYTGTKKIYSPIKIKKEFKQKHIFLVIICLLFIPFNFLHSQVFEFDSINSTVRVEGFVKVDNDCNGAPNPPPPKSNLIQSFIRSGVHNYYILSDLFLTHVCDHVPFEVSAWARGEFLLDGDNTDTLEIKWLNCANVKAFSELFNALAWGTEEFTLNFVIKGQPIGAPVTCYYEWRHFGAGLTEHEWDLEDPVFSDSYFSLDDTIQWNPNEPFYFADPPDFTGWNLLEKDSTFQTFIGDTITLVLGSYVGDTITNQVPPHAFHNSDKAYAVQHGWIKLSLKQPADPLGSYMLFSNDIGADREFSDSKNPGNEFMDPGDMYRWRMDNIFSTNSYGQFDDAMAFFTDPKPYSIATGAPTCSGLPVNSLTNLYFDLDGFDALNVSLNQHVIFGPGLPSVAKFNSTCIHNSEYLWISYDDDKPEHYVDSIPTSSFSPGLWHTYGTSPERDEIIGLHVLPYYPSPCVPYPYADESYVSKYLDPNPDSIIQLNDDDIDALDIKSNACAFNYFSPDHEATYGLLPGSIYEVRSIGPTPSIEVINGNTHLGLPVGTDINAFEFVWLYDTLENRYGLALLFSVDDDDPLTPVNESGALNPAMIYGSFLNGTYFEYLIDPLDEDIDAIAANSTPWLDPSIILSINETKVPENRNIISNYPNPFSDYTNIIYNVLESNHVELSIYDMHRRKVATLVDEYMIKGVHSHQFNASGLIPGVYVCSLRYGSINVIKKIMIIK